MTRAEIIRHCGEPLMVRNNGGITVEYYWRQYGGGVEVEEEVHIVYRDTIYDVHFTLCVPPKIAWDAWNHPLYYNEKVTRYV